MTPPLDFGLELDLAPVELRLRGKYGGVVIVPAGVLSVVAPGGARQGEPFTEWPWRATTPRGTYNKVVLAKCSSIARGFEHKNINLGRFVWEWAHGPMPMGKTIDHVNGDVFDNRLENLCPRTPKEQNRNQRHGQTRGAHFIAHRTVRPWRASVRRDGVLYHFGYHATELEAVRAADAGMRALGYTDFRANLPEGGDE